MLGKLSFLPVEPIMVLTADKNRKMGAGDQQEKAAAPLAVPPVTCPRPEPRVTRKTQRFSNSLTSKNGDLSFV